MQEDSEGIDGREEGGQVLGEDEKDGQRLNMLAYDFVVFSYLYPSVFLFLFLSLLSGSIPLSLHSLFPFSVLLFSTTLPLPFSSLRFLSFTADSPDLERERRVRARESLLSEINR